MMDYQDYFASALSRLKAALRENLKRRKAQARGRKSATESQPPEKPLKEHDK